VETAPGIIGGRDQIGNAANPRLSVWRQWRADNRRASQAPVDYDRRTDPLASPADVYARRPKQMHCRGLSILAARPVRHTIEATVSPSTENRSPTRILVTPPVTS
jgi:hypothetical protein